MQIGCHASVWSGEFDTAALEQAISQTRQAGCDLIEIPLTDPDAIDRAAVRRLLTHYDLAATASLGLGFHRRPVEYVNEMGSDNFSVHLDTSALAHIGYDKPVVFEPFSAAVASIGLH